MTAAASPQRVIADELINSPAANRLTPEQQETARLEWAQDILGALAEAGYAVVSVLEPDPEKEPR